MHSIGFSVTLVGVLSADWMRVLNRVQNAVCAWGFLSANMIIIIMHCSCMMIYTSSELQAGIGRPGSVFHLPTHT